MRDCLRSIARHVDLVIEDGLNAYDIVALDSWQDRRRSAVSSRHGDGGDAASGGSIIVASACMKPLDEAAGG